MRIYLLFCFLITSFTASFAQQQAVATGDTMLCPGSTGYAMVQGFIPYDSYQWQFHYSGETTFVNVAGATSSTFAYDQYTYSDSYIRCQVSQNGNTFYSNELFIDSMVFAGLTVEHTTSGQVGTDPETGAFLLCDGASVSNSVGMPYTIIQWYKNGQPIAGATQATYVITEPGEYYVTGAPASCPDFVQTLPSFTVAQNNNCQDSTTPVIEGDTLLCPESNGTAEITNGTVYDSYQWQVKFSWEDDDAYTDIEGATSASFTYDQYNYSVTDIRVRVTLDGETYYSNVLSIDSIVFAGLLVEHTTSGQVTTDPETGAFLLCGDAASVSNTVLDPYTIVQWYKDGQPVEGATQMTYVITAPGEYYVVASPAECPNYSETLPPFTVANNPDCTAGIENPEATSFTLYPNPATAVLNINLPQGSTLESYTIVDVSGKTLLGGALTGTEPSINIQALAAGSYIIKVSGQGTQTAKMFIKQ